MIYRKLYPKYEYLSSLKIRSWDIFSNKKLEILKYLRQNNIEELYYWHMKPKNIYTNLEIIYTK